MLVLIILIIIYYIGLMKITAILVFLVGMPIFIAVSIHDDFIFNMSVGIISGLLLYYRVYFNDMLYCIGCIFITLIMRGYDKRKIRDHIRVRFINNVYSTIAEGIWKTCKQI